MRSKASIGKLATILITPLVIVGLLFTVYVLIASLHALAENRESISIQWKRPLDQPVSITMTQDGKFFGSVAKNGTVQLFDRNGRPFWKKKVDGVTDVMIARNGQSLLVYSKLNPKYQDVRFFRGNGQLLWKHQVEGSVWDGAVSADGKHAAVTTGKQYLYIYRPDPNRPKFRRWRMDGIGHTLTFTPDNKRLIIGTWQDSQLVCFDVNGSFLWKSTNDCEKQYELSTSADGQRILGILPGRPHDPGLEVRFWNSAGKLLWKESLEGFDGRAFISPKSQYVAISYADSMSKSDSSIIQRKVAVYRNNGQLLWEKGGLFFGPRLVALSPSGSSVIVSDGEKSLYIIDKRGKILSKLSFKGSIRKTIPSEDGTRILVYCSDGWLYLMRVG